MAERQQLRFSRYVSENEENKHPSPVSSWSMESIDPPTPVSVLKPHRQVTFTVQNVPSSPVVYESRYRLQRKDTNVKDTHQTQKDQFSNRVTKSAPTIVQKSAQRRTATAVAPRPRKSERVDKKRPVKRQPAWDDDVHHGAALFDTSLKKSLLFQPRAGDRKEELEQEALHTREQLQRKISDSRATRKDLATSRNQAGQYSSARSTIVSTSTWRPSPQLKKDFVKMNIERIAGQNYDKKIRTRSQVGSSRSHGGNVFERLSAPLIPRSLLRFRSQQQQQPSLSSPVLKIGSPTKSVRDPIHSLSSSTPISSPVSASHTSRAGSQYAEKVDNRSPRSSPRKSPAASPTRSVRSSGTGQKSFAARVFEVLDRQQQKRIGVEQVLQGLRLLGLPATHNQVSDYIYLIHEGAHNSIDQEEWEILVGTLDAASQPPDMASPSVPTLCEPSIPPQSPSRQSVTSERSHYLPSHLKSPYAQRSNVSSHGRHEDVPEQCLSQELSHGYVSPAPKEVFLPSQRLSPREDDLYIKEIQRRVEEIFQRTEAAVSLRRTHETVNNQCENENLEPNRILKRAASVVYSLKATLYPLVQQAEETLKEIQKRHGTKLSLFLSPSDISTIAQNSDILASAILDDIILDTVQVLNDEEKLESRHQLNIHHVSQLDAMLAQIQKIELQENNLIEQGFTLDCPLPNQLKFSDSTSQTGSYKEEQLLQPETTNHSKLTLPIEVVMNVQLPDEELQLPLPGPHDNYRPGFDVKETSAVTSRVSGDHLSTSYLQQPTKPISTSILQGRRFQNIEKRKHKFQQHRRLVEASLAGTGMDQCAVIEILEEMVLNEIVEECASELEESVVTLSDTLLTTLI